MGASRTLTRKIDSDLVARIEAGGKPVKYQFPKNRKPRTAATYRGARRNAAGRGEWFGVEAERQGWDVTELNRSKNLPPANSYKHAAEIAAKHSEFRSELLSFPAGKHDDQVDERALLLALRCAYLPDV